MPHHNICTRAFYFAVVAPSTLVISKPIEQAKRFDDRGEWWSARDMAKILDYSDYRNFLGVIEKAKTACENSGYDVNDHIGDNTDNDHDR